MLVRMKKTVKVPNAPAGTVLHEGWKYKAELVGETVIAICENGQKVELSNDDWEELVV